MNQAGKYLFNQGVHLQQRNHRKLRVSLLKDLVNNSCSHISSDRPTREADQTSCTILQLLQAGFEINEGTNKSYCKIIKQVCKTLNYLQCRRLYNTLS